MQVVACVNIDESVESSLCGVESRVETINFNNLSKYCTSLDASALLVNMRKFDVEVLNRLKRIKKQCPSLAILISSNRYIELLSFWCLRNKIIDYVILPDEIEHLQEILCSLRYISNLSPQEARLPLTHRSSVLGFNQFHISSISHMKTKNAIRYINENYNQKIKLEVLASECNYSIAAFSQLFKKENGISAMEYVNRHRITVAKRLLSETNQSVSCIAHNCGFEDASYFVKVFKNIQTITPANYRKTL